MNLFPEGRNECGRARELGRQSTLPAIPANAIRRVFTQNYPVGVCDPNGICISGASITGAANWNRVSFLHRVEFEGCRFDSVVKLRDAKLATIAFKNCNLPGLVVDAANIQGGLLLSASVIRGQLSAAGTRIEGQLNLSQVAIDGTDCDNAVVLDSAHIDLGVFAEGLLTSAAFRAVGTKLADQFNICGARLYAARGSALNLDGANIDGSIFAVHSFILGGLRGQGLKVSGQISLEHAEIRSHSEYALCLDSADITSGIAADDLIAIGGFSADGLSSKGSLEMNRGHLSNRTGPALSLKGVRMLNIEMSNLTAFGEIAIKSASVSGHLDMKKARLGNSNGSAVLVLDGANVANFVDLSDAILASEFGIALSLNATSITGDLVARGSSVSGQVNAIGVRIGGELTFSDSLLKCCRIVDSSLISFIDGDQDDRECALNISGGRIDGGVYLHRTLVRGEIRAINISIRGRLEFEDSILQNLGADALNLEGAQIGSLILRPEKITGNLHLDLSSIDALQLPRLDEGSTDWWHPAFEHATISAAGWRVSDIRGGVRRDWKEARGYLEKIYRDPERSPDYVEFIPQPWFEVADVYERIGHPDQARHMRLHVERQITRRMAFGRTKILRLSYAAVTGYGYMPARPSLWLLGSITLAGLLIWTNKAKVVAVNQSSGRSANDLCRGDGGGTPCFSTLNFTLQNLLPTASGAVRPEWTLAGSGQWAVLLGIFLALLRIAAWVFAAIGLAAMTGLVRRR